MSILEKIPFHSIEKARPDILSFIGELFDKGFISRKQAMTVQGYVNATLSEIQKNPPSIDDVKPDEYFLSLIKTNGGVAVGLKQGDYNHATIRDIKEGCAELINICGVLAVHSPFSANMAITSLQIACVAATTACGFPNSVNETSKPQS